jgi:hypothetical protein
MAIAAKIPIIATTINNSINVKPDENNLFLNIFLAFLKMI